MSPEALDADVELQGDTVRLEALRDTHALPLLQAAYAEHELYRWTFVPTTTQSAKTYVDAAIAARNMGSALPFVVVRNADTRVVGTSRFWNIERWDRTFEQTERERTTPDACEIGWTWLSSDAIGTEVNVQIKLLMLDFAFQRWHVFRVCFHTDERNVRSRYALAALGAKFEGILRAHRFATDGSVRNSARYSITSDEWDHTREGLLRRLQEKIRLRNV